MIIVTPAASKDSNFPAQRSNLIVIYLSLKKEPCVANREAHLSALQNNGVFCCHLLEQ